jgi:hypothetical protein
MEALRMGPRGRSKPLFVYSGDTDFINVSTGGVVGTSVDDLPDVVSSIFGVDGTVLLYLGFCHLPAGVLGADVGANKDIHFVLALCAAAAIDILCAKFGVLTACA